MKKLFLLSVLLVGMFSLHAQEKSQELECAEKGLIQSKNLPELLQDTSYFMRVTLQCRNVVDWGAKSTTDSIYSTQKDEWFASHVTKMIQENPELAKAIKENIPTEGGTSWFLLWIRKPAKYVVCPIVITKR